MDPLIFLTFIMALAAAAAAVFAFVQAKSATDSRVDALEARDEARKSAAESARLAGEANDAFKRQAVAQEEANRLKIAEMTPPDWRGPTHSRGDLYNVVNSSRRTIIVDRFEISPPGSENYMHLEGQPDNRYEYGDSFELATSASFGGRAKKLVVHYHFDGEATSKQYIITL